MGRNKKGFEYSSKQKNEISDLTQQENNLFEFSEFQSTVIMDKQSHNLQDKNYQKDLTKREKKSQSKQILKKSSLKNSNQAENNIKSQIAIGFENENNQDQEEVISEEKLLKKRGRPRKNISDQAEAKQQLTQFCERIAQSRLSNFLTENQNQQNRYTDIQIQQQGANQANSLNQELYKDQNIKVLNSQKNQKKNIKKCQVVNQLQMYHVNLDENININQCIAEPTDSNLFKSDNNPNQINQQIKEESKRLDQEQSQSINQQLFNVIFPEEVNQKQNSDLFQNQTTKNLEEQKNQKTKAKNTKDNNKKEKQEIILISSQLSLDDSCLAILSQKNSQEQSEKQLEFNKTIEFLAILTFDITNVLNSKSDTLQYQNTTKQLQDTSYFVNLTNLLGILGDQSFFISQQDLDKIKNIIQTMIQIVQNKDILAYLKPGYSLIIQNNCNECLNQINLRIQDGNEIVPNINQNLNSTNSEEFNDSTSEIQQLKFYNQSIQERNQNKNLSSLYEENQQKNQGKNIEKQINDYDKDIIFVNEVTLTYKQSIYDQNTGLLINPSKEQFTLKQQFQSNQSDFGDNYLKYIQNLKDQYKS